MNEKSAAQIAHVTVEGQFRTYLNELVDLGLKDGDTKEKEMKVIQKIADQLFNADDFTYNKNHPIYLAAKRGDRRFSCDTEDRKYLEDFIQTILIDLCTGELLFGRTDYKNMTNEEKEKVRKSNPVNRVYNRITYNGSAAGSKGVSKTLGTWNARNKTDLIDDEDLMENENYKRTMPVETYCPEEVCLIARRVNDWVGVIARRIANRDGVAAEDVLDGYISYASQAGNAKASASKFKYASAVEHDLYYHAHSFFKSLSKDPELIKYQDRLEYAAQHWINRGESDPVRTYGKELVIACVNYETGGLEL